MKFGQGVYKRGQSYPFERARFFANKTPKELHYGLPQWGSVEWKGSFYKHDSRPKDFLKEYSTLLDCVEVSSSFYADLSKEKILSWKEVVGESFRFLPKWPRLVTHDRLLNNCQEEIKKFVSVMESFDQNLGASIVQLPPSFSTNFKRELFLFLEQIPKGFPVCLEFRDKSWFESSRVFEKLEYYLVQKKIGMVCTDTPDLRDLCHMSFTSDHHIIRYVSDENSETDRERLQSWQSFLEKDHVRGSIYFVLHMPDNTYTPELFRYLDVQTFDRIQSNREERQTTLL